MGIEPARKQVDQNRRVGRIFLRPWPAVELLPAVPNIFGKVPAGGERLEPLNKVGVVGAKFEIRDNASQLSAKGWARNHAQFRYCAFPDLHIWQRG